MFAKVPCHLCVASLGTTHGLGRHRGTIERNTEMALKPARDAVVDAGAYTFTVIQATPKVEDPATGKQKVNAEQVPLWTIDCLRVGNDGAGVVSVTVAAVTRPTVMGAATFDGLRVGLWLQRGREGGGLYWVADAVRPAGGPERPKSV